MPPKPGQNADPKPVAGRQGTQITVRSTLSLTNITIVQTHTNVLLRSSQVPNNFHSGRGPILQCAKPPQSL